MSRAFAFVAAGLALAAAATAAEPQPAVTLRAIRPDEQLERLLTLFEGSRARHPAAALAAWKRATGGSLGNTREAALAALNPEMVAELKVLHGAELSLWFDVPTRNWRWRASVPGDDGTLAALATALCLTDGGADEAVAGVPVDRLGPRGGPVVARLGSRLVVAADRQGLVQALTAAEAAAEWPHDAHSGWSFAIKPESLASGGVSARSRLVAGLHALACDGLNGEAGLEGETLSIAVRGHFVRPLPPGAVIERAWLDWVPAAGTVVAAVIALPDAGSVDVAFTVADQVQRVDPTYAKAAPLRSRLNALALGVGIWPERDLWPRLMGITAYLRAADDYDGLLVALHCVDDESAHAIAERLLPRIATAAGITSEPNRAHSLGRWRDRPVATARVGATVLAAWGEGMIDAARAARDRPDHSAGSVLGADWQATPPHRLGAYWPGRDPAIALPGSAVARALGKAPPVIWRGSVLGGHSRDRVQWTGLKAVVREWLARVPLEPGAIR
jgi:hypothetical protein